MCGVHAFHPSAHHPAHAITRAQVPTSIMELRAEVEEFSKKFPTIGFEKSTMRYQD